MERSDGATVKEYLKELKLAIINCDFKKLEELSSVEFISDDVELQKRALALISEALNLLESEKQTLSLQMQNLQKMKKYLLTEQKEFL